MAPYQMQPPPACPALYLYPLNDTFVPKQIALGGGGERNGYFDSKVLSRQHAEVWEENGKIYIKDVKSSNGTFINGDRLSAESVESEPCELKSEDIVEFGIDIVGEDNKTIIHHKGRYSSASLFAQQQHQHQQHAAQQAQAIARRQQGPLSGNNTQLGGLGGLGQGQAPPAFPRDGSRATESHYRNERHSRYHGPPPPPQHQLIPPVRQPTAEADVSAMQTQLRETQSSLQAHVDKIRAPRPTLEEHEAIKREVGSMREMLSRNRSPLQLEKEISVNTAATCSTRDREEFDDDFRCSKPKTPEPMAMLDDARHQPSLTEAIRTAEQNALHAAEQNAILSERLEALTAQLEQAITLSQGLQTHAERASSTIAALEAKVIALEEEQRAARVLGGQPGVKSDISAESDIAQLVKSELMREMEHRWDAWRAKTEEDREADKRTLAAALEQFKAVVDNQAASGSKPDSSVREDLEAIRSQLGQVDTRINQLSARIEEVSSRIEHIDNRVGDVDARVGDLDGLVSQVGNRVTNVEDHVSAELEGLRRTDRTRADAVRAISGLASDSSTSTLDAMQSAGPTLDVRKRVRKRSSRGSSGEDNSSLASSMTRASFSTRATSPSEDEGEEEDETKRTVLSKSVASSKPATASSTTQTESTDSTPSAGTAVVSKLGQREREGRGAYFVGCGGGHHSNLHRRRSRRKARSSVERCGGGCRRDWRRRVDDDPSSQGLARD
ncbi:Cell cycle arrest in response pheromone-related protein [Rhizoctonia solani]|uniref:Cell cycle arrest in response pheromone-related protein n=1 Tax=Rhizoctonia solani TaxID=456999 RepID=A0A8H7M1G6_9AGAM|nr:Cell cycle arrest in response pheromone-related protein [Rhizoctonia solani]